MKKLKTIGIIVVAMMLFINHVKAQVPADSLSGTYAGQYWYANPYINPWVITPDTFNIQSIDSINCRLLANDQNTNSYGGYYYTNYYYCNGTPPSNYYMKFYAGDSLKWIDDDVAQPPPNSPISTRFYGKRISNKITGLNVLTENEELKIFPNPCTGELNIEYGKPNEEVQIIITNMLGREIINKNLLLNEKVQMDVSDLINGIYFLQIKTQQGTVTKKILIEK